MPTVFILKCRDNCYYIGKTNGSYFKDIDNHFKGMGCEWTQKHKPIRVEILRHFCDETDDDFYTRLYMTKYGLDKVRGGSYGQLELTEQQLHEIRHYPIDTHITCLKCFMKGHKGHLCPFIRSSCENGKSIQDIILDTDDEEEGPFQLEPEKNNAFLTRIIKLFSYPIRLFIRKCYSHRFNDIMSMRLGRSGSFHGTLPKKI